MYTLLSTDKTHGLHFGNLKTTVSSQRLILATLEIWVRPDKLISHQLLARFACGRASGRYSDYLLTSVSLVGRRWQRLRRQIKGSGRWYETIKSSLPGLNRPSMLRWHSTLFFLRLTSAGIMSHRVLCWYIWNIFNRSLNCILALYNLSLLWQSFFLIQTNLPIWL